MFALFYGERHGFAGDGAGVDVGAAGDQGAVGGDAFAWADEDVVPYREFGGGDGDGGVAAADGRLVWCEVEEGA